LPDGQIIAYTSSVADGLSPHFQHDNNQSPGRLGEAFASEVPLPNASRSVASRNIPRSFFLQQEMLIDDGMKQLL
jgi:hypothetical protein